MAAAEIVFICVGTPQAHDNSADLRFVFELVEEMGPLVRQDQIVITKSTVPVGTTAKVRAELEASSGRKRFHMAHNPEFLKQGSAVQDFMHPDRIIVGLEKDASHLSDTFRDLFRSLTLKRERIIFTGIEEAEMIKYAANSMLATKISFINELANLCHQLGVDVSQVRHGIASDSRIGYSFLYPGCGYGGSCLPKDVQALMHLSVSSGYEPELLKAVDTINRKQKQLPYLRLQEMLGDSLASATVAVWGLSFKPETDDLREAPSIDLLRSLTAFGAKVRAYDPVAMPRAAEQLLPLLPEGSVELCDNEYEAIRGSNALVLLTEWKQFRSPDFRRVRELLNGDVLVDGRNLYDPPRMRELGFRYVGVGRP
jgi:UDPglucose 6-dehydrogenase